MMIGGAAGGTSQQSETMVRSYLWLAGNDRKETIETAVLLEDDIRTTIRILSFLTSQRPEVSPGVLRRKQNKTPSKKQTTHMGP